MSKKKKEVKVRMISVAIVYDQDNDEWCILGSSRLSSTESVEEAREFLIDPARHQIVTVSLEVPFDCESPSHSFLNETPFQFS